MVQRRQRAWMLHWATMLAVFTLPRLVCGKDAGMVCGAGEENWPAVLRSIIRILDGSARPDVLHAELLRTERSLNVAGDLGSTDCDPGRMSLRLLLFLLSPPTELSALISQDWSILQQTGWLPVIRSGWPVFRLLRLLQRRAESAGPHRAGIPNCQDDPFARLLLRHVRKRQIWSGESLLAESATFLERSDPQSCPLSIASAFLTSAWGRFPVYDIETEQVLELAEMQVRGIALSQILSTEHTFLELLDEVAGMYQAFLIDSGALYGDENAKRPKVDYTRHMMSDEATQDACSEAKR